MKFICPNNTSSLIDYILKNYIKNDMIIADMTLGNGYDSCNILSYLNGTGFLYALDIQDLAINKSMENLKKIKYLKKVHHLRRWTFFIDQILLTVPTILPCLTLMLLTVPTILPNVDVVNRPNIGLNIGLAF